MDEMAKGSLKRHVVRRGEKLGRRGLAASEIESLWGRERSFWMAKRRRVRRKRRSSREKRARCGQGERKMKESRRRAPPGGEHVREVIDDMLLAATKEQAGGPVLPRMKRVFE